RVGVPGFEEPRPSRGANLVLSPASGEPGETVALTATGLPGHAPVTIAAGPAGSQPRALGEAATTSGGGRLATEGPVPDWADRGETLLFVVETEDGRVRLVSEPFPVEASEPAETAGPKVTVTGTLSREGAECQALRGDDGQLYTLSGDAGGFEPGDRVRVTG